MLTMSNSDVILKVENLSKVYFSKHQPQRSIKDLFTIPFAPSNKDIDPVVALNDVSFELKRGECLGIVGPNGAGKSTLLKILSGISSPTSGKVTINGRVLSVLDIGTGFHPDLTGRENVYLNGEILGMSRSEIDKKYQEIVDFSGVGDFINRPVKQYSSGMYLRLAFSIVVTLDADLLLFDEVLAVGDSLFQEKSINRLYGLLDSGRSVIIVSHDNTQILNLTIRALLLENGFISSIGNSMNTIKAYKESQRNATVLSENSSEVESNTVTIGTKDKYVQNASDLEGYLDSVSQELSLASKRDSKSSIGVSIHSISINTKSKQGVKKFRWEESVSIVVKYQVDIISDELGIALIINDSTEHALIALHNFDQVKSRLGLYEVTWFLHGKLFGPGNFYIDLILSFKGKIYSRQANYLSFEVEHDKTSLLGYRLFVPIYPEALNTEHILEDVNGKLD